jgi:hypothetical protein
MPGQVGSQPEAKGGGFAPALPGSPGRPAQPADGQMHIHSRRRAASLECSGSTPPCAAEKIPAMRDKYATTINPALPPAGRKAAWRGEKFRGVQGIPSRSVGCTHPTLLTLPRLLRLVYSLLARMGEDQLSPSDTVSD